MSSSERKRRRASRWGQEEEPLQAAVQWPDHLPPRGSLERAELVLQAKAHALGVAAQLAKKLQALANGFAAPPPPDAFGNLRNKIFIPTDNYPHINFLGLLLGPRGSTHKRLESESGARVLIRGRGASKQGMDESDEDLHVLVIADTPDQLNKGSALVSELLFNPNAQKQRQFQPGVDGREEKVIHIPEHKVGLVIGRLGETILNLQAQTNCSIQVTREPEPGANGTRSVTLQGTQESMADAEAEIWGILNGPRDHDGGGGRRQGLGFGSENSKVVQVPANMVGLVIGKKGDTIRQLQESTGARIQVTRDNESQPGSNTRGVSLSGPPDAIERAEQAIKTLLGQMGGNQTCVLLVPSNGVGLVIGKKGENIRFIQQSTGARVQIAKEDNGAEREVTLTGSPDQIERAKVEILQLVEQHKQNQTQQNPRPNRAQQQWDGQQYWDQSYGDWGQQGDGSYDGSYTADWSQQADGTYVGAETSYYPQFYEYYGMYQQPVPEPPPQPPPPPPPPVPPPPDSQPDPPSSEALPSQSTSSQPLQPTQPAPPAQPLPPTQPPSVSPPGSPSIPGIPGDE